MMADPVNLVDIGPAAVPALDVFSTNQRFKVEAALRDQERRSAEKQAAERNKIELQTAEKELKARENIAAQEAATRLRVQELQNQGFEKLNASKERIAREDREAQTALVREEREADEELARKIGEGKQALAKANRADLQAIAPDIKKRGEELDELRRKQKVNISALASAETLKTLDENPRNQLANLAVQVVSQVSADTALRTEAKQKMTLAVSKGIGNESLRRPASFALLGNVTRPASDLAFGDPKRIIGEIINANDTLSPLHESVLKRAVDAVMNKNDGEMLDFHSQGAELLLDDLLRETGTPNTQYAIFAGLVDELQAERDNTEERLKRIAAGVAGEGDFEGIDGSVSGVLGRKIETLRTLERGAKFVLDSLENRNIAPGKPHDLNPVDLAASMMAVTSRTIRNIVDSGQFTDADETAVRQGITTEYDLPEDVEKQIADRIVELLQNLANSRARFEELTAERLRIESDIASGQAAVERRQLGQPSHALDAFLGLPPEVAGAIDLGGF